MAPDASDGDNDALAGVRDRGEGPSTIKAPHRHLPRATFGSIEYPGPVSHHSALLKVVHQDDIDECFNAPATQKPQPQLELNYRPHDRSSIPVRGHRVSTAKMLVRVKRRRRRDADDSDAEAEDQGVFTADVVGTIPHTVRFRAMADYHYTPKQDTRIASIVNSLRELDYDAFLNYSVAELDETFMEPTPNGPFPFRSVLDLQPSPSFTNRLIPVHYAYKNHPQSTIERTVNPRTGETTVRYINKSRQVVHGIQVIGHQHSPGDVPQEAPKGAAERLSQLDQKIVHKLRNILAKRPVWLRHGLLAQLTKAEQREIELHRTYLSALCYTIGAGPFWKCLIRFGYDPCAEPEARQYQRTYFYLHVRRFQPSAASQLFQIQLDDEADEEGDGDGDEDENEEGDDDEDAVNGGAGKSSRRGRTSQSATRADGQSGSDDDDEADPTLLPKTAVTAVTLNRQMRAKWMKDQMRRIERGEREPLDPSKGHIFNGKYLDADKPDYQLCDITDPLIRRYIDDSSLWRDQCDSWSGWYLAPALTLIRNLTKVKYTHIYETGTEPSTDLCYGVIETFEREMQVERGKVGGAAQNGAGGGAAQTSGAGSGDEASSEGDDENEDMNG